MSTDREVKLELLREEYMAALRAFALGEVIPNLASTPIPEMRPAIAVRLSRARAAWEACFAERDWEDTQREPPRRAAEPMLQLFGYAHLPADKQDVSRPFGELACYIVDTLPRNPERTAALRKLREAKDAAVTCSIWKE